MKPAKPAGTIRTAARDSPNAGEVDQTLSTPELADRVTRIHNALRKKVAPEQRKHLRDGYSASESDIFLRQNNVKAEEPAIVEIKSPGRGDDTSSTGEMHHNCEGGHHMVHTLHNARNVNLHRQRTSKEKSHRPDTVCKKSRPCSPLDAEDPLARQIRDIHNDMRSSVRIIKDSRARLVEIQKKPVLTELDAKELVDRHELLLREMDRFDRLTRTVQRFIGSEMTNTRKQRSTPPNSTEYVAAYESAMQHEMKMTHPTVMLTHNEGCNAGVRSKSEIDLTRKLSESYDMQEKLVADNADLEVKRYMLYKELMTKDQNLETCRSQITRLQGELKLMSKENAILHDRLDKCNSEGDATAMNQEPTNQKENKNCCQKQTNNASAQLLVDKLENYKTSTLDLERQLGGLELEVRHVRVEMDQVKAAAGGSACKSGAGVNSCFVQPPGGPPVPPASKACGVCPPCPAVCNPNGPPTPAEREVARLSLQLHQTEENFRTKVTECAMLRAELIKKKEELEKERCQHKEVQCKLRELEMRFEGLNTHTNMLLGTKEQAFETEVNVRALKNCYREAREEIDELRKLLTEQNNQLQDYRVKYMQAQQLVEEQKRQMDLMDMDNTRISEQINLEIQRVKLKFQEKLQELAPLPDLLKATQARLKDAQQLQALAEHNAEQLARELNVAREKVHTALHATAKPEKAPGGERTTDDKQMMLMNQRISQLSEANTMLKSEIERLKGNVIKAEESVLMNEKRLQEKMHECAQLGGELDRTRDEAARALQRSVERQDTIKKCLQTTIAELERQLATSRAAVKFAQKEREELQARMSCQIKRLNENFEQAQLRILGLTTQVNDLRRANSSTGAGDDPDGDQCLCKSIFDTNA